MKIVNDHIFKFNVQQSGTDLGNCEGGGRVCVSKGEALDRGTKFRAGGGYGRGVSPSLCRRK